MNSAFAFPRNGTVLSLPPHFWEHITPNYPRFCMQHYPMCDTFLKQMGKAALTCFCRRAGMGHLYLPPLCRDVAVHPAERASLPTPRSTAKPRRQCEADPKSRICARCWFPQGPVAMAVPGRRVSPACRASGCHGRAAAMPTAFPRSLLLPFRPFESSR